MSNRAAGSRRRPPRLGQWLLRATLPSDVRQDTSGDLEEMFHRRMQRDGARRARAWYLQQSLSFAVRFSMERLRERWRHADIHTGFSWVDFKLAVRMLVRYPGLTLVGVIGMALGIAIATAAFTISNDVLDSTLPLEEGDRIVSIVNWDVATNNREQRTIHEFGAWREQLRSVQEVGAFRTVGRNLVLKGNQPQPVSVAEMTAAGFNVARVSPTAGRYLRPEDERAGAPDVVVIGHEVWRGKFGADPSILDRQIQLGDRLYSIVGVMPPGFGFPVNHSYWVPLRLDPAVFEPRSGPGMNVFGRLAPGATLDSAQTELSGVAQRMAAAFPRTHEHLRSVIVPYAYAFNDMDDPGNALVLRVTQTLIVMLLVIVCINVAILVYARTATRHAEITVRTALGATRRRIVAQLFLEALVLAGTAAVAGIAVVAGGLRQLHAAIVQLDGALPFWMEFKLSPQGVIYVVMLTVFSAAIVGVVPALKATGRRVQGSLQGFSAGGGSRMEMGRLWTTLIVAQVAFAVALLPATVFHAWNSLRPRSGDRGFATSEVLTARVFAEQPADDAAPARRLSDSSLTMLERTLENEGSVAAVTFSLENPGEELAAVLEAEGVPAPVERVDYNIVEGSRQGHLVRFNRVATDFFDAFQVPVLMGRGFRSADTMPASTSVLVNRTLVDRILSGANPLGRRLRYVGRSREAGQGNVELSRWYEIVGVVPDFPPGAAANAEMSGKVYHPVGSGGIYPAVLSIRVRGITPSSFADQLREIATAVDPALQLRQISTYQQAVEREKGVMRLIGFTLIGLTFSVVALSGAGIYALMSFTVARRRKEIGIRAALGADSSRILSSIFARALRQLGAGAGLGLLGAIAFERLLEGEMFQGHGAVILPIVAVIMCTVGLLAAWDPARRGLQIQLVEALREE
ncbi:MAG TPA: ABC transporter permease [Vicinamibacterales bacterium]|nr:ABC transporter permease [Vicinamibacterales bacterium]